MPKIGDVSESNVVWNLYISIFLSLNCTEICSLGPDPGHTLGTFGGHSFKFYYDISAGTCKKFKRFFGGGNANSFDTIGECMARCKHFRAK